ncbi:SMC5-SMC6 complex localization factor protein 2 isoform X1 [Ranitomeya variabilis]|uniref:SMC5-SMC6 complex localization factor protein 2 isoform X1 n=1 Tax=Ranitomeya variabilis TaxID=490064 RepID=UPI0040567E40
MTRPTARIPLSQGNALESPVSRKKLRTCGAARNHHITEFFRPSSKPDTDALISALRGAFSSESMQLQSDTVQSWNDESTTVSQKSGKISSSSSSPNISTEARKGNQKIVRNYEAFCQNCDKSLLSPRVLLKRLILPANSQVYVGDSGGHTICSDKDFHVSGNDAGPYSPMRLRSHSRSKRTLTISGRSSSLCIDRYFDIKCQTTISSQSKHFPLKSPNLLRSDLQAPPDLCQDDITQKNNMAMVINLSPFVKQVNNIMSTPGDVLDDHLSSPSVSDCYSLPGSDEASVKKLKKAAPYKSFGDTFDNEQSFKGCDDDEGEEEEIFKSLDEILKMTAKPVPTTPQRQNLDHSFISGSQSPCIPTPVTKNVKSDFQMTSHYVNNLDQLVKEQKESRRLSELEKQLHADLERGLGLADNERMDTSEDGELTEEHREFLEKFKWVTNAIPEQHPGEEVFHLSESGAIFNLRTLDLKHSEMSAGRYEDSLIFSCAQENQITLAMEGYLTFLYRYKKCPDVLMKWMFQMISIHPSYAVSVKLLHTLIEISCNNLSNLNEKPWMPSLLDIATVFANMGIHFDTLFPLPNILPSFGAPDLVPAVPLDGLFENGFSEAIFSCVPKFQIAHVIKFLGFCSAICRESFCDLEILALIVLLLKLHLEKDLKDFPAVDLHCLIETLLQNIKSWDTVMPEMFYAISELSTHHHNYIKLLQLIPTSENRGRQLRKHLSLIFLSNILYGNCKYVPLDYDSQMLLLCRLMSEMRPSSLAKKMETDPENISKTSAELDQEAYYLTFSLLNLVNDASISDEPPFIQRKYILKLCTELEKHIKSDIREDARYFYRTKVKDLVARIHGRWQEQLLYSRPNQGKLHDYWEPKCDSSSPKRSEESISDSQDFPYDDN